VCSEQGECHREHADHGEAEERVEDDRPAQ
jgi:hypothetical protein